MDFSTTQTAKCVRALLFFVPLGSYAAIAKVGPRPFTSRGTRPFSLGFATKILNPKVGWIYWMGRWAIQITGYPNRAFTSALALPKSIWPANLPLNIPMTLPMSFMLEAPVSAITCSTAFASSLSSIWSGKKR